MKRLDEFKIGDRFFEDLFSEIYEVIGWEVDSFGCNQTKAKVVGCRFEGRSVDIGRVDYFYESPGFSLCLYSWPIGEDHE